MGEKIRGIVTKKWVERFLLDCVNLPDDLLIWEEKDQRAQKVVARYPEVFAEIKFPRVDSSKGGHLPPIHGVASIASLLRDIWDAPDLWLRNWHIYKLQDFHYHAVAESKYWEEYLKKMPVSYDSVNAATDGPPPISALTVALMYLQKTDKARHCPNPACPAPYFFATKRGQRHCSQECAAECTREAKRRWWNENRAKGGIE